MLTNKALQLAQKYGTVTDTDAASVFKEYTDLLREQKDLRSLAKLSYFKPSGASVTRLIWQGALAKEGMRVIR